MLTPRRFRRFGSSVFACRRLSESASLATSLAGLGARVGGPAPGLLALAVLAFASGCEAPTKAQVPVRVEAARPLRQHLDVTLRYPIELLADEQVSVKPVAVSGLLRQVLVDVGDKVRAGQVVATLDCREYAAQGAQVQTSIKQRRAQLEASKSQLARLEAMADKNLLAPVELDNAKASFRVASAQLAEAQARLSEATQRQGYCSLKAPFEGYVSERILHPGAMVEPGGDPVVTLVKSRDVLGVVSVIEQDVAKGDKGVANPHSSPRAC